MQQIVSKSLLVVALALWALTGWVGSYRFLGYAQHDTNRVWIASTTRADMASVVWR
jgi:hypothetical protein